MFDAFSLTSRMVCSCSSMTVSPADPCVTGRLECFSRSIAGEAAVLLWAALLGSCLCPARAPHAQGRWWSSRASRMGHQEGWGKERRACRRGGPSEFAQHGEKKAEGVWLLPTLQPAGQESSKRNSSSIEGRAAPATRWLRTGERLGVAAEPSAQEVGRVGLETALSNLCWCCLV